MQFETAVLTDPGGRELNEDCCDYFVGPEAACWALADGLGGHGGGDVAAALAVRTIIENFGRDPRVDSEVLNACFTKANEKVAEARESELDLREMRTTIVTMIADRSHVLWGHVGDSRLYVFRDGVVADQTKDHSVPQMLVDAGDIGPDQVRYHEDRNKLLRSLGAADALRPTILAGPAPLAAGEIYVLLTDGFWEHVTETAMAAELAKSARPDDWLRRMEARLRAAATGEYDNYSAVAVFVNEGPQAGVEP